MIVYSAEERTAMAADLRRAQAVFDASIVAGIHSWQGIHSWLDGSGSGRFAAGRLFHIERDVRARFVLHRDDLGLAFAAIVEYADYWGFSVEVLDEEAPQWRADTNHLAMAAVA